MKITIKTVLTICLVIAVCVFIYMAFPPAPWECNGCKKFQDSHKFHEGLDNISPSSSDYTVTKLGDNIDQVYDTICIEKNTGNLLDVSFDVSYATSTINDVSGTLSPTSYLGPAGSTESMDDMTSQSSTTITGIKAVYGRSGGNQLKVSDYTFDSTTITNKIIGNDIRIVSSYTSYDIVTDSSCQIFCIPWDKETYLISFNNSMSPNGLVGVHYVSDSSPFTLQFMPLLTYMDINTSKYVTNSKDNQMIVAPLYSSTRKLYQICDRIAFDPENGSIITYLDRGINVYERIAQKTCGIPEPHYVPSVSDKNTKYSPTTDIIADVGLCAWSTQVGSEMQLVYVGNGKMTVIAVFNKETNSNNYNLINAVRFFANGTRDDGTTKLVMSGGVSTNPIVNIVSNTFNFDDDDENSDVTSSYQGHGLNVTGNTNSQNPLSDYYKWAEYWNSVSSGKLDAAKNSQYMLKSQFVPPVCPQCPYCRNGNGGTGGVCTNCGGNGGSGTLAPASTSTSTNTGTATSTNTGTAPAASNGTINTDTFQPNSPQTDTQTAATAAASNELVSMIRDTGSGIRDLLTTTESNLKSILENTGGGIKDMVTNASSGLKEVVTNTGSGVKTLMEETGSGIRGTVNDAVGGIRNVAYDAVGGVSNTATGTIGLIKDTTYDAVGGVRNVAYDAVGGIRDVTYDAVGGVRDIAYGSHVKPVENMGPSISPELVGSYLAPGPAMEDVDDGAEGSANVQNPRYGIYSTAPKLAGSDPYSYFGALPDNGSSEYIPVTTDFSAFRK